MRGVVQGVGFRPFVYGLARPHGLTGFVLNDGGGVVIEAEGRPASSMRSSARWRPRRRRWPASTRWRRTARGERRRRVRDRSQRRAAGGAADPADIATCDDCLRELFDPADRRHRYPFINCTQCGPRFTIVRDVPYDRPNTTMAGFAMCADCRREYADPADRRFHAEPIACPAAGRGCRCRWPRRSRCCAPAPMLAVKGLGGYHLACDATDEAACRACAHESTATTSRSP